MPDVNNTDAKIGQQNNNSTVYNSNVYNTYGEKKIKKFLGLLPFFSETFLGRENDLEAVHQKLFDGNNLLLLVNGEGGIGKTTLAARYYLKYQDDYEHLAWVFVATSLSNALLTLALPLGISFPETMNAEDRIQQLLDELRNLSKPCLLVIDNANEIDDLEEHYQALRSCANFHMLLTTRITEFEQAATYKIEPLEKKEAFELFKKCYPKHKREEDALLEKILMAVGYNTLVIELLAKYLNNINKLKTHYSLEQLLQDLQGKGLLGLSLSKEVSTSYQATGNALRKETPEAIIEAMYELSELPEEEVILLSVFAVLPAESIAFETLESLTEDTGTLEDHLLSLTRKGWLNYNETDTSFKVSPVVQEITKNKNSVLLEDCRGVLRKLMDKLLYERGVGHFINVSYEEAALYARYAEAAINSIKETDADIAVLCERMGNYYKTIGNLNKGLTYYESFNRLAEKLHHSKSDDEYCKYLFALSYYFLGVTQEALGNSNKALTYYEDYHRLEKELHEANPHNNDYKDSLAVSYSKLGEMYADLKDVTKALTYFEENNRLEKELYEANPQDEYFKNGLAISYERLGEIHSSLKDFKKALTYYDGFNQLENELYYSHPQNLFFKNNLAVSYQNLGEVHTALGNLNKGLPFYENYNRIAKQLYDNYPQNIMFINNLVNSYQWLGWGNEQQQNIDQAKEYYKLSQKLLSELVLKFPEYVKFKNDLEWVEQRLSEL